MAVQERPRLAELGNSSENREEVRLLIRTDVGQAGLMIALEKVSGDVPTDDVIVIERKTRVINAASDDRVRIAEVMFIMAVSAAESQYCGDRRTAAARPPRSLLVV